MRSRYFSLIERFFLQRHVELAISHPDDKPHTKNAYYPYRCKWFKSDISEGVASPDEIFSQGTFWNRTYEDRDTLQFARRTRSLLASSNSRHARTSIKLNWIEQYRSLRVGEINNRLSAIVSAPPLFPVNDPLDQIIPFENYTKSSLLCSFDVRFKNGKRRRDAEKNE